MRTRLWRPFERHAPALPGAVVKRVGHKGAHHVEHENTIASFDAALEHGVDMIEFDIIPHPERPDQLVIAHDQRDARERPPLRLERALHYLAQPQFASIEFDIDLKGRGYEFEVARAIEQFGLTDRALVSSQYPRSLTKVRAVSPRLRVGWSVPKARHDWMLTPLAPLALLVYGTWKLLLPAFAFQAISGGRCDAIMAHHRMLTPALLRAVRDAGGELYIWTVDKASAIAKLEQIGVSGIISNDPRLFTKPSTY